MKPTDLRDATWEKIQSYLTGARLAVYEAWRVHGPATTEAAAKAAGINILTFRPRTTELYQIGLVQLLRSEGTEGIYCAVPPERAQDAFEKHQRDEASHEQLSFKLAA